MKRQQQFIICFIQSILAVTLLAQVEEGEVQERKRIKKVTPNVFRFDRMVEEKGMTEESFREFQDQRTKKLEERMKKPDALEGAVDPDIYIVGPGDIFTFNIWGALEEQFPLNVTPDGYLLIPSVGELPVDGKTLHEVQQLVLEKAKPYYKNSKISLTMIFPRFVRIHVVGEVNYPGTYVGQPMNRVSHMIAEAGGPTDWAWLRKIEIRHTDGSVDYFDMFDFKQYGNIKSNLFINGGDVIYVPPMQLGSNFVEVEGELENSGTYQIYPDETLITFLQRIRVIERNMDLSKIIVIRSINNTGKKNLADEYIYPFQTKNSEREEFQLVNGDRILIPSKYVYVKGTVRIPGAYPYALNLRAKDYAGMAGGDFRSGSIKGIRVYHTRTGKTEKGEDVLVEPGDIVEVPQTFELKIREILSMVQALAYVFVAYATVRNLN